MPRQDGRIEKGQSLKTAISARAWNRAQDAADVVLGAPQLFDGGDNKAGHRASNIVLVQANAGSIAQFSAVQTTGSVLATAGGDYAGEGDASDAVRSMAARPVLSGQAAFAVNRPFLIAIEPIPLGAIGRCAASGAVFVKLSVVNETHQFADINGAGGLVTAECGPARILYKDAGTGGMKWAVVVL